MLPSHRFEHLKFVGDQPATPMPGAERTPAAVVPLGPQALDHDSQAFFDALCALWGLEASRYRDSILARRKAACLRALGAASAADGLRAIRSSRRAAERALGAVMIGVTEFFRDPGVFQALEALLRGLERPGQPLRALSLGCSDGSELYSLAILLAEQGLLGQARLLGIDARPAAIEAARAGVYPDAAVAHLPVGRRQRYFAAIPAGRRGGSSARVPHVAVSSELRAACQWLAADAFALPPEGNDVYDLMMCRNVAIYLNPEGAAALWALCLAQVRPGGLIIVGKAERPPSDVRSSLSQIGPCIYRRKGAS
jgi:chemotaxis protein methyltransferase CheR